MQEGIRGKHDLQDLHDLHDLQDFVHKRKEPAFQPALPISLSGLKS